MNELSTRIWQIAKVKGWTLPKLAEHLGVSVQALYAIKTGRTKKPSYEFMEAIKSIGVNPEWVMTGNGIMELVEEQIKNSQEIPSEYLMNALKRIEQSFVGRYEKTIETQERIIDTQQRMIDNLMVQLTAVGKPNPITEQTGVFTYEKPILGIHRLGESVFFKGGIFDDREARTVIISL